MARNELKAGVILSYVNLLIGNLIPFFYTPVMLELLGQSEYGLYGIANSVMGYIGLLNFGIGSAIIRYLSLYRARGDREGEEGMAGLFLKLYGGIALLILLAGMLVSVHLEGYSRSLSAAEVDKLKILVRLMTANTAVFLPFSVFSSLAVVHERYLFNRLINILSTVAAPCLNLAMLYGGFASVGLVAAGTLLNLISYAAYTIYVVCRLNIRPRFGWRCPGLLREIFVFSAFAFLGSMVDILYWATDKLIIGWAVGAAAVTIYNVGASFNSYVTNLSTAISGVLMPRITSMVTRETPSEEFSDLFIKVGRLQFLVVSFIVSAFVVFGRQFLALWVGVGYDEAYPVALLTMLPVTVPLIQNTGLNILYAMNRHRFRSVVYLIIALLNVALTFCWVERYGMIGAAAATCLAYLLGNVLIMNWYYARRIGLNISRFWKNIGRMCPTVIVFLAAGLWTADHAALDSWPRFFTGAAIYTLLYLPAAYAFMMDRYERELCIGVLKKLLRRRKRED